jgi:hypothetical protein
LLSLASWRFSAFLSSSLLVRASCISCITAAGGKGAGDAKRRRQQPCSRGPAFPNPQSTGYGAACCISAQPPAPLNLRDARTQRHCQGMLGGGGGSHAQCSSENPCWVRAPCPAA